MVVGGQIRTGRAVMERWGANKQRHIAILAPATRPSQECAHSSLAASVGFTRLPEHLRPWQYVPDLALALIAGVV